MIFARWAQSAGACLAPANFRISRASRTRPDAGCGSAATSAGGPAGDLPRLQAGLAGAADAGTAWSQVWDVKVIRWRTEYLLPRRRCGCGTTTTACPPNGGLVNG